MRRRVVLQGLLAGLLMAGAAGARGIGTDDSVSGLQTTLTRVRGSDRHDELGAFGLWTSRLGYGQEKGVSVRVLNTASLAFGANGIQGGTTNAFAGGYRFPVAREHGPLVRGGVDVSFYGNRYLWDSNVEIPQVHLGWQWLHGPSVVDVALKSGYVLFGRHNTGDGGSRRLDGVPELGGIGSVHLRWVDVRASYTHLFARREGAAIQWFDASLCTSARGLSLCSTTRYEVGDVFVGRELRHSQVSQIGIAIGLAPR